MPLQDDAPADTGAVDHFRSDSDVRYHETFGIVKRGSATSNRSFGPLWLSSLGFSLIPIAQGAKVPPRGSRWRIYQDSGTTPEQVEQWSHKYPNCNWAVILGRASGLVSLDVDSAAALHWVEAQGGFRSNGRTPPWYETGRGWQFIFRLPADLIAASGCKPWPHVDIQCNRQISIVPPSIHPSGKPYQWKKPPESFESIPYPPLWMTKLLQQRIAQRPAPRKRNPSQQTTANPKLVERHKELAGVNRGLLKEPGTAWLESCTFRKGYRHSAFFPLGNIYRAAGLPERECERRLDQWRLDHTRPVYGACPDEQSQPTAVFECIWKYAYGLDLTRLMSIRNATGETMPESLAIQLVRAYPRRRNRSERVHKPILESVARVLVALKDVGAFEPMMLTHAELGRLAGITSDRVAKIAGFLDEIGVRTVRRKGRSYISCYCLKNLNLPPTQLIKHFARWRCYRGIWSKFLVMCKGLWLTIRPWMKKLFNTLNAIWNRITGVPQGETVMAASGKGGIDHTRGPPA